MLYSQSLKKISWLLLTLSITSVAQARLYSGIEMPLPPRISVSGTSGNKTFGEADAMIPFFGNTNQIIYGDTAGKFGDDRAWLASLGVGIRKIIHDDMILGAYFFGDYNKSPNANYYPVINLGLEYMTNLWDAHLNGYLPVGVKTNFMGTFAGTQLGINNRIFFTGHTEYDSLFNVIEDVGAGADFQAGRTFMALKRTRIFAGGYYFTPKYTSNVQGVTAGFEAPLKYKWATVQVRDSYDNVNHNTFALTLLFTFGGLPKDGAPDIHDRMLDRIPRHLGNLDSGDGIPSQKEAVNTGNTTIVRDNIWFFDSFGAPTIVTGYQSCTYEHPCNGLAQTQIDTINGLAQNANFYFSPGTYNNPAVGTGFSFYNGQNIFGRTSNYKQLATGSNRPLLNDSLSLSGNNNVYNVRIFANSELLIDTGGTIMPLHIGVLVTPSATGVVNVYNSDVVANATVLRAAAVINNSPTATLNVNSSTLAGSLQNLAGGIVIGAGNVSSGNLNLNKSSIMVNQADVTDDFNIAFGVVNNENGTINIAGTDINVSSTNGGLAAGVLNNSTVGQGTINISRSSLVVASVNSNLTADVFNQANNGSGIGGTINIDQSSLTSTSTDNGGGTGVGIFNSSDSTVNLTNSVIVSSGNDGTIAGILNSDPLSTITLQNNSISLNLSGTAVGAPIINGGTFNDNGGNVCTQNGVVVPC